MRRWLSQGDTLSYFTPSALVPLLTSISQLVQVVRTIYMHVFYP